MSGTAAHHTAGHGTPAPMATWVLLRGLTREQAHWGGFAPQLAHALAAAGVPARVLAVDLPGAGLLHAQRCPLQVPALVQACQAQLAAQGVQGPVNLLGLSLGGMVAVSWLLQHPQQVAACVLVNSSMRPLSPLHHRLRPRQWPRLAGLLLRWGRPGVQQQVLALTSQRPGVHAGLPAQWHAIQRARPVRLANALRQLWAAARFVLPPQVPQRPVLVLCSDADALVDPRCSQALARHWQAPLRRHPEAGHDLPLDDGAWVAAQVAAWAASGLSPPA